MYESGKPRLFKYFSYSLLAELAVNTKHDIIVHTAKAQASIFLKVFINTSLCILFGTDRLHLICSPLTVPHSLLFYTFIFYKSSLFLLFSFFLPYYTNSYVDFCAFCPLIWRPLKLLSIFRLISTPYIRILCCSTSPPSASRKKLSRLLVMSKRDNLFVLCFDLFCEMLSLFAVSYCTCQCAAADNKQCKPKYHVTIIAGFGNFAIARL